MDLPVVILDNDFRNPDTDRYLDRFDRYNPSVAVLGDAYTPSDARELNHTARVIKDDYPYKRLVIVPKCNAAFDILDDDIVLGYPMGYSDVQSGDVSGRSDWRGRNVHLLGASPPKQYAVLQELTQPTLTNDPPANIVGLDWNGPHKGALKGEYWSRDGWQPADHLTIRETVRESLQEIKLYWQERGVWPATEPIDLYGPAVKEPDHAIFMDDGGEPVPDRKSLELAYVTEYEDIGTLAFEDETAQSFIEYRDGLTPVRNRGA